MRRERMLVACFVLSAIILPCPAKADPITANITLTVEPNGLGIAGVPYVYTGLIPDLNSPPSSLSMSGSVLGAPGPIYTTPTEVNINTPFNMTITLNDASGSNPTIDVTGNVTGSFDETAIPSSSFLYAEGFTLSSSLNVQGTATSATLQGWTPNSGIPMSLINEYLNPSIYSFSQTAQGMSMASSPQLLGGSTLQINLSTDSEVPEPAAVLIYLVGIAGAVVGRHVRSGGRAPSIFSR